eukprot:TRINITY_DN75830_c0_g1_i1.p1 TRINITY_DN75830_c0_g1~~TRINITY_DN75830_c0_g1_i1.p1  ORF type:complete len:521 (+),score=42.95 TRINITY_DN75830_c0_g1_i1:46-1608(+)
MCNSSSTCHVLNLLFALPLWLLLTTPLHANAHASAQPTYMGTDSGTTWVTDGTDPAGGVVLYAETALLEDVGNLILQKFSAYLVTNSSTIFAGKQLTEGNYTVANIAIVSFSAGNLTFTLSPPNTITLSLVANSAKITADLMTSEGSGNATISWTGGTVNANLQLNLATDGSVQLAVLNTASVFHPQWVWNSESRGLSSAIQQQVEDYFSLKLPQIIYSGISTLVSDATTAINTTPNPHLLFNPIIFGWKLSVLDVMSSGLVVDASTSFGWLQQTPTATIQHYTNPNTTQTMLPVMTGHSLSAVVSLSAVNQLLSTLHDSGLLVFTITDAEVFDALGLHLSSYGLEDIFPTLYSAFPNQDLKVVIYGSPGNAPTVGAVSGDQFSLTWSSVQVEFVRIPQNVTAFTLGFDVSATFSLYTALSYPAGKPTWKVGLTMATLETPQFSVVSSNVGDISVSAVNVLLDLFGGFLPGVVNTALNSNTIAVAANIMGLYLTGIAFHTSVPQQYFSLALDVSPSKAAL